MEDRTSLLEAVSNELIAIIGVDPISCNPPARWGAGSVRLTMVHRPEDLSLKTVILIF